ncbi:11S globulin seed storage protein Ana o 2.0101-like [Mercurialis annua]|uniref:11S globulin seed storage protein Ana o 2.0101-like n=1 Tax=Mercurialis annua TaxID=3986 RepID=UPI00215FD1BA|nr:11S globulin seed storage protein Ana o 2.0101-like [Mercurialis annua]
MGYSSLLSVTLCLLIIFSVSFAQLEQQVSREERQQRQQRWQRSECQLNRINAVEPSRQLQSEAGLTEIWDENDQQFQCAGVVAMRHTIQQKGLLLPQYVNGPKLIYVVRGNGIQGAVFPGCPETYQTPTESSQSQFRAGHEQSQRDQHQKVRRIRSGDVIALPEGVAQWIYNSGRTPLVLVQIIDTSNPNNQLDQNHRDFFLAGNPQREVQSQRGERSVRSPRERGPSSRGQTERSGNVFRGIDERMIAEAFNINTDLARKMRGENDNRGIIVSVVDDLEMLVPRRSQEEEREEQEAQAMRELERSRGGRIRTNGVEETYCTLRLKHNINDPLRADIYNPRAGRVKTLNNHNLPILRYLQLSIHKTVLYRNAIMTPHWNINAHSIRYITRGTGRVQIVNENGNPVFDGQVREGQILTVPQNFVVITKASEGGLEWVSFKTNDNAKISQLAGRVSAIRSMPEEVVANAFQVSIDDARRLKDNRQEVTVLSPGSRSRS